jgi:hypothetical protein
VGHDCAQRFTADANNYIYSVAEAPAARFAERGIDARPVTIVLDLLRRRI